MQTIMSKRPRRVPSRAVASKRTHILVEAIEKRMMLSVTLTGSATNSGSATTTAFKSSYGLDAAYTSSFSSAGVSEAYAQEFGYVEFGKSFTTVKSSVTYTYTNPSLYPSGYQVGAVDALTLTLQGSNNASYGVSPAGTSFELFLATNETASATGTITSAGYTYNTSYAPTGIQTVPSSSNVFAPIDLGSFTLASTLTNAVNTISFTSLSSAVQQDIASALNGGQGVRFLIGANAGAYDGFTGADFTAGPAVTGGIAPYPGSTLATVSLQVEQAAIAKDQFALSTTYAKVNEGSTETYTVSRTIGSGFTDTGATVSYATADGTGSYAAKAGTNYTAESGNLTFTAGQTVATFTVPTIAQYPQGGNLTYSLTLSNPTNPTGNAAVTASAASETTSITDLGDEIDTAVSSQSVAENAGTAVINLTRTITYPGTDVGSVVTYSTAPGSFTPAVSGVNYTAETGTYSFAPGQTTGSISIPVLDAHPQFGPVTFILKLGSTDPDSRIYYATDAVTITDDDQVSGAAANTGYTPSGSSTTYYGDFAESTSADVGVLNAGVATRGGASYLDVNGSTQTGAKDYYDIEDFNDVDSPNAFQVPSGDQISDLSSITIGLYAYPEATAAAGPFNVYVATGAATDTSVSNNSVYFNTSNTSNSDSSSNGVGGTVGAGGVVTGSQLGTLYPLGQISYTDSESTSGYTNYIFKNISLAAQDQIISAVLAGEAATASSPATTGRIRIVLTPASGTVEAGYNGIYTGTSIETPELSLGYYVTPTAWVAPGHGLEYSTEENTLYVYGAGETGAPPTITADPGATLDPSIVASGATTTLAFTPSSGTATDFHIGGITLNSGATATETSLDATQVAAGTNAANHATNHDAIEVSNVNSYSVTGGELDLVDNDLILHYPSGDGSAALSTVQGSLVNGGFDGGAYDGTSGLTSSAAGVVANTTGATGLGIIDNNDPNGFQYSAANGTTFDGDSFSDTNEILVKYTYNGDAFFEGTVNNDGVLALEQGLRNTKAGILGNTWLEGNFDYSSDGSIGNNEVLFLEAGLAACEAGAPTL